MNPIDAFLRDCDAVAQRRCLKRSTVSTAIFRDGKRLDQLARGDSDIGVLRLERAKADLAKFGDDTSGAR